MLEQCVVDAAECVDCGVAVGQVAEVLAESVKFGFVGFEEVVDIRDKLGNVDGVDALAGQEEKLEGGSNDERIAMAFANHGDLCVEGVELFSLPEVLVDLQVAAQAELVGQSRGKYVLIKDDRIVGVFDSEMDAAHQGYERFGNVPFLVKQVVEVEVPLDFTSSLLVV